MRYRSMLPACALLLTPLSLLGGTVRAQEAPALRPTLAQALAALEAPKQDLFLTVGADKILLPPDAPPPDPSDRPGQVGAAYGRLVRDFGGVTALAPPTMVVLNTRPGVPNLYDRMPAEEALKLLLAGLNPLQWAALTDKSGLGLADLDDARRGLFRAVLPPEDTTLIPTGSASPPSPAPITLTARDMAATRLRLRRRMQIAIPMVGNGATSGISLGSSLPDVIKYCISYFPPAHEGHGLWGRPAPDLDQQPQGRRPGL